MNKIVSHLRIALQIFVITTFFASPSFAAFGLLETAEIIPAGVYRVGAAPQLYLGNGGGVDGSAFLDLNVGQSLNSRLEIGSGVSDFWASASAKFVPYPDYQNQPAMGIRGKVIYMREADTNFYNTQIAPIFSKKYSTERGEFIPYAGLPITFIYEKSSNNFTISKLCFGSEWVLNPAAHMGVELAMDLYNGGSTYTYTASTLSLFFNFQFDERIGFKK
ncbi:MAG: hypothetical protein K0R29_248 [Pseudobdellovibrio sp.]|jgi:hypothetical protein|nr:hypothetical protein [Pseudobdellovibrio sp.]